MVFEQLLNVEDAVSMDIPRMSGKVFFRQCTWILVDSDFLTYTPEV